VSPWSNDSPGAGINVGIGTREIAIGLRPSRSSWSLRSLHSLSSLRRVRSRDAAASEEPRCVPMPDAQCFTEAGVFDALRVALEPVAGDGSPPARRGLARTRAAYIVLDDFWVNHAILRGDFRALRAKEIDEIARAHFVDTYDVNGGAMDVRVCVQRGGRAAFASALPLSLVEGIRGAGASAGVAMHALTPCLPRMLDRALERMRQANAMFVFAADSLMHAVLIEAGRWAGYDAQRLFNGDAGDPVRLASLAEQAFEHCATHTATPREAFALGLYGVDMDFAPLQARFASVTVLAAPGGGAGDHAGDSVARRLLEYAQ
jgi:hypothetical protein